MARIVHLSDLHFGAHDERLVEAVAREVDALKPDLVVISGDFTQRARTEQFREACQFLEGLRDRGHEVLGVPGNHDVPLYDVLRRFLSPLARYRRFIDESLCPFVELPGVAVLGINTARSLTFKDGRINRDQVDFIRETFAHTPSEAFRIIVTHHPLFALEVGGELERAIGRQEMALDAVEESGVDMVLAGHAHHASSQDAGDIVTRAGGVLVVQAGTATSTRVREQEQSFNIIDIGEESVTITVHAWKGDEFRADEAQPLRVARGALAHIEIHGAGALEGGMALPDGFDLDDFVQRVLAEDLGKGGDVTSAATIAEDARFTAAMNARQSMVVAGHRRCSGVLPELDADVQVELHAKDGDRVEHGATLMRLKRKCAGNALGRAIGAQHAAAPLRDRDAHAAAMSTRSRALAPRRWIHARRCRAFACSTSSRRAWAARRTTACASTTAC